MYHATCQVEFQPFIGRTHSRCFSFSFNLMDAVYFLALIKTQNVERTNNHTCMKSQKKNPSFCGISSGCRSLRKRRSIYFKNSKKKSTLYKKEPTNRPTVFKGTMEQTHCIQRDQGTAPLYSKGPRNSPTNAKAPIHNILMCLVGSIPGMEQTRDGDKHMLKIIGNPSFLARQRLFCPQYTIFSVSGGQSRGQTVPPPLLLASLTRSRGGGGGGGGALN